MKTDTNKTAKKLQLYRERMQEIVHRLDVVQALLNGDRDLVYLPTTVESIYLQFRNVLELIATASLVMNDAETTVLNSGGRKWHAGDILNAVETVNPGYYYPTPTRLVEKDLPNVKGGFDGYRGALEDFKGDYLNREKFATLYDVCSKVIHTPNLFDKNPYIKSDKRCQQLLKQAGKWRGRIITLLTHHQFQLAGDEDTLYVAHTVGKNAEFHITTFTKMKSVDANSSAEEIARARTKMLESQTQDRTIS